MAKTEPSYRLVVFNAPEDPPAVRDLLCRVADLHPTDAAQWVARTPGILPRPLSASQVRAVLDGLYDLGVPAEAWRSDSFPDLGPPRTIHDAACLEGGLRIKGLRGEPTHWVPWDRVELVSAGRIAAEDEFRTMAPPRWSSALAVGFHSLFRRPGQFHRRARAARIIQDPVGEVHVVRRDPRLLFRVVANQMNYASLGGRLRPSTAENFRLFLAELCTRAEDAYITPSTRAFLQRGDPDAYEFPSSQALLDYTTHRLLWSWYRRDRDSDAEQPTRS